MSATQGEEILGAALAAARRAWPDRLIAAYALGSLAHGGFSAVSDVDIGFLLADPLLPADTDTVAKLAADIRASRQPYADRLSIFWGSVQSLNGAAPGGRFPPLDRLDLIRYGRLLAGRDVREQLQAPPRCDLVIAAAEFALARLGTDDVIAKLRAPALAAASDWKTLTKLVLFPVRFLFTARTGEVGRNDAAVEHFVAHSEGPAARLAHLAREWRNRRPSEEEATAALRAGALPLYREFLLDHERRLDEYGRPDLAAAIRQWRDQL